MLDKKNFYINGKWVKPFKSKDFEVTDSLNFNNWISFCPHIEQNAPFNKVLQLLHILFLAIFKILYNQLKGYIITHELANSIL